MQEIDYKHSNMNPKRAMVRIFGVFVLTAASISCSSPINTTRSNVSLTVYESGNCLSYEIEDYQIPPLPNLELSRSDYEAIDMLVEHIRILREDISKIKSMGCKK